MRPRFTLVLVLVLIGAVGGFVAAAGLAAGASVPRYPDLRTQPPADLRFDRLGDGTHVLRFSNTVWNAGEGRLELEGYPRPHRDAIPVYQNLYDAAVGGSLVSHKPVSSDILYHLSHNHYHFQDFASYLLLKKDASGTYQETTKKGTKTSFCIMDSTRVSGTYSQQYGGCDGALQGLTVGWGDDYVYTLPDQWVVLGTSRLADGTYAVQSTADPKNKLDEGGRDGNNVAKTCFKVRRGKIRAC